MWRALQETYVQCLKKGGLKKQCGENLRKGVESAPGNVWRAPQEMCGEHLRKRVESTSAIVWRGPHETGGFLPTIQFD